MTELETLKLEEKELLGESPLVTENISNVPQESRYLRIEDGSILQNYSASMKLRDAIKQSRLNPLTEQQKQLVLGTLLGDGWMSFRRKFGPTFHCCHGMKQVDYVIHQAQIMQNYINTPPYVSLSRGFNKTKENCRFNTVTTPALEFIRTMCYEKIEEKYIKTVKQEWLDQLTWEGISYWYFDDGSIAKTGRAMMFATNGFPKEQVDLLANWLNQKGVICHTTPTLDRGKMYYTIRVLHDGWAVLIDNIKQYALSCLEYKLNIQRKYCRYCSALLTSGQKTVCINTSCQNQMEIDQDKNKVIAQRKARAAIPKPQKYCQMCQAPLTGTRLLFCDSCVKLRKKALDSKCYQKRKLLQSNT